MRYLILAVSLIFISSAFAAKTQHTDHPLVSAYEGSKIKSKDVKRYDEYTVFKGWDKEAKDFVTETLEGKVTRILYVNPQDRSELELYRNYQAALDREGVEILFECNQAKNNECMDRYVGATLRQQFQIHGITNKAGRYLFSRLEQDEQVAYVVLSVGDRYTDVHVVEMKKMDTGKVTLNMAALADGLDRKGFVVVEGIYFDTDKTTVKPESAPALEQVALLLNERPELKVYVVGHTDMQGSLSHNMRLSEGRAEAVVKELVVRHGIDADRLAGHGVGPLAPQASNAGEDGRARNRRVVLVAR